MTAHAHRFEPDWTGLVDHTPQPGYIDRELARADAMRTLSDQDCDGCGEPLTVHQAQRGDILCPLCRWDEGGERP